MEATASQIREQLTTLDQEVLGELCRTRVTRSAVILAADLYGKSDALRVSDPTGIVGVILEGLSTQGLVRYYLRPTWADLSKADPEHKRSIHIPVDIRVTPLGYAVAGYPIGHREVGRMPRQVSDDSSVHRRDGTDFRSHGQQAQGIGEIERMPLPDHCFAYPSHAAIHAKQLKELREMTTDYIHLAANAAPTPPVEDIVTEVADELTVERIMREQGVGRRWAYAVLHREKAALVEEVPTKQRDQVLVALFKHKSRDATALISHVHADGVGLDAHDVTKTLWALQKTGHVKFRERQNPRNLYAIKLTEAGWDAAAKLMNAHVTEAPEPVIADIPVLERDPYKRGGGHISRVPTVAPGGPIERVLPVSVPVTVQPVEAVSITAPRKLTDRPAIHEVWKRAVKSQKLSQAAALLEDADDPEVVEMALALMSKTDFTPLERDVIDLLRETGELE